jgi:hypothetical protein
MLTKILATFQTSLNKGVKLPFGTKTMPLMKNITVTIQDDCLLVDAQIDQGAQTFDTITKLTLQNRQSQALQIRKYPVVYHIASDNSV